jgi:ABC-2 type transport system permease protein
MLSKWQKYKFLFSELVKRDFKKKYKRTYLGMLWSVLSPLLTLLIMRIVFSRLFGNSIAHFTTYLFCGNIVFSFFSDSTNQGMGALLNNAAIFTKVNVPKYLFLFSKITSSLINFILTFGVFLLFCAIDGVVFTPLFFSLLFPIICMVVFNMGIGLILSALFVFFRDVQYLWSVFTMLLMYLSAIFYDPTRMSGIFGVPFERILLFNPVYVYIKYFRLVTIGVGENPVPMLPSVEFHLLALGYAVLAFTLGALIYKKYNHKFLYYV